ncbi:MAG: hypothetical protein AAGA03_09480 [Planctomycetota bacterium]
MINRPIQPSTERLPARVFSAWHRILALTAVLLGLLHPLSSWGQEPGQTKTTLVPGIGVGSVKLKPTRFLVSIPLKVARFDADEAIEVLIQHRDRVLERAIQMGVDQQSMQTIGLSCGKEVRSRSPIAIRNQAANNQDEEKQVASCYFVAEFPLAKDSTPESALVVSRTRLTGLVEAIPTDGDNAEPDRRYMSSSMMSRINYDAPNVVFLADVTPVQKKEALGEAIKEGIEFAEMTASVLELTPIGRPVTGSASSPTTSLSYSIASSRDHPVASLLARRKSSRVFSRYPNQLEYTLRVNVSLRVQP